MGVARAPASARSAPSSPSSVGASTEVSAGPGAEMEGSGGVQQEQQQRQLRPTPPPSRQQPLQRQQQAPKQRKQQPPPRRAAAQGHDNAVQHQGEAPFIDPRYRKMTCYNCGEPGHFVGNCLRPKVCFICGVAGHHMNICPAWKADHPIAAYVRSSSQGLGFYHVEIPTVEYTKWLNLTNCGVVRVKSGQISLVDLEAELSEIYCKEWPWQIREL